MSLKGGFCSHLTDCLEIHPRFDAQRFQSRHKREELSAIHIGDRSTNSDREVELGHGPALSLWQGVEKLQDSCIPSLLFRVFLFFLILWGVNGSGELKNCQSFTLVLDGISVRPEVQECRDRGLELLVTEKYDPVLDQFAGGEAQPCEKVCLTRSNKQHTHSLSAYYMSKNYVSIDTKATSY